MIHSAPSGPTCSLTGRNQSSLASSHSPLSLFLRKSEAEKLAPRNWIINYMVGHEYERLNRDVEALATYKKLPNPDWVTRLRAANKPTVPTLLGEEKKANVFLRADEPSVAAGVRMKGRSAAEVFGELRERKNKS